MEQAIKKNLDSMTNIEILEDSKEELAEKHQKRFLNSRKISMMTGSSSTPINQNQKPIKQVPVWFTPPISAAINGKLGI